jgi:pyrimidine-nucleoside phosphorylase
VKTGSGAFMKTEEDAAFLAELMVETGERMGKKMVALLTDMDQPLGFNVGNSLEAEEVLSVLRGKGPEDLRELCTELAAWMFVLGGRCGDLAGARSLYEELIQSGSALAKFGEMIELQGGDPEVIEDPAILPRAKHSIEVRSPARGYVGAIQCEAVGTACVVLGGGREKKEDAIDPAVGIVIHKKVSDRVVAGDALCTIHYNDESRMMRARQLLQQSYSIGDSMPSPRKLIHRVIKH